MRSAVSVSKPMRDFIITMFLFAVLVAAFSFGDYEPQAMRKGNFCLPAESGQQNEAATDEPSNEEGGSSMIETAKELATAAEAVAKKNKTLYVMGCFGAPMTENNKQRYINHHSYNRTADRKKMIMESSADTYGFDCVCFIKGLLWGWNGNKYSNYGGAKYASNGVPDIDADSMIKVCKDVSKDFSDIQVGEAVWMKGHIGVYIGGGLVVECSPKWANGVQITAVTNIGKKSGYNSRKWTSHGKLPYVTYDAPKVKTVDELAREVIAGKWGSGADRKKRLTAAGYDYTVVQKRVNEMLKG